MVTISQTLLSTGTHTMCIHMVNKTVCQKKTERTAKKAISFLYEGHRRNIAVIKYHIECVVAVEQCTHLFTIVRGQY